MGDAIPDDLNWTATGWKYNDANLPTGANPTASFKPRTVVGCWQTVAPSPSLQDWSASGRIRVGTVGMSRSQPQASKPIYNVILLNLMVRSIGFNLTLMISC